MSITIKDLGTVYEVTFNARGKWRNLLLKLGLDFATIESIRTKCNDNPDDCYLDGLSAWLKNGDRNWRDLVKALSSPTVGHKDMAEDIEKSYVQAQGQVLGQAIQSLPSRQPITSELVIFTNEMLGNGAFGQVFKGSYKGMPCAIKVLHHIAMHLQTNLPVGHAVEGAVKTFDQECELLVSLRHPNIIQHLSTEKHPMSGNTILVIELMDYNLRVYFSSLGEESLSSDCQLGLSKDVASGLAYIHSKYIIHRDLCGDNILLKLVQPVPTAKISDFGMSRLLDPSQLSSTLTALGHRTGYLPPEAPRLEEERYDYSLDVFSLGVVMVQIVHKLDTIKSPRDRSFFVAQIPDKHVLKPLINKCLQEDRSRRPTASRICMDVSRILLLPRGDLRTPISLEWRAGKDMPIRMGHTVQSVVIGDTVYVGGGTAVYDHDRCTVMKLDLTRKQWSTLPQCNAAYFAMTSLDDQLILVGGRDPKTDKKIAKNFVLQRGKWTHLHPPMNIARDCSTAVSFNNHIIVAGGHDDQNMRTSSVEILDMTSNSWYIADPIPDAISSMKPTLIGSTLYLMGGYDHHGHTRKVVNIVDINELIDKAKAKNFTPTPWQTIENIPFSNSAPLIIRGSLLAVGGCVDEHNPNSSIHLYKPDGWVKVGELLTAQYDCTCSVLPNGKIIVAGGSRANSHYLNSTYFMSFFA